MSDRHRMMRRQTILKRGWTERMIDKLLGDADAGGAGRYFLYDRDRVKMVEATAEFANFDRSLPPVTYISKAGLKKSRVGSIGKLSGLERQI